MKKKLLLMLAMILALSMIVMTACSGGGSSDDGGDAEESKTITIGCEATTPGWITQNDAGEVEGFEVDIWNEIAKRTGYTIDFQVMDWDGMWSMLDDGRIDTVAEQISYTPERDEKFNLSAPYAYNRYCLLSRADNEELQTMDDIKTGMTISCESNTSDDLIVDAIDADYNVTLERTYYDGMSVTDVAMGRCDLWPRAETSCNVTIKEVDNLKILGKTNILEMNVYPFTATDEGKALCDEISSVIDEMREDGTIAELSNKWFEQDISVKPEGAEGLDERA